MVGAVRHYIYEIYGVVAGGVGEGKPPGRYSSGRVFEGEALNTEKCLTYPKARPDQLFVCRWDKGS
jgi:hypothetical protein